MPDLSNWDIKSVIPGGEQHSQSAMTLLLFNLLRDVVRVPTGYHRLHLYLLYPAILSAMFGNENRRIPIITVVTDLATVHNL